MILKGMIFDIQHGSFVDGPDASRMAELRQIFEA